MPNIKSAMKRDAKSKELRAKNRADKTALKTVMKKFDAAVAGGDKTVAAESHILTKKDTKRCRRLRSGAIADVTNEATIKKMIPYK